MMSHLKRKRCVASIILFTDCLHVKVIVHLKKVINIKI